ncbi:DUF927 domain-containing protein [Methylobacterium sp. Leaf88]|uniref:DUF927 domain-containing protein n=1 Tax=Methylobacterium sp. Leaf88 TaxID=1736244 RepID=UPI0009E9857E|nr:DUF927 domain-containing protein [Methylobacterium sp. Leaf88]
MTEAIDFSRFTSEAADIKVDDPAADAACEPFAVDAVPLRVEEPNTTAAPTASASGVRRYVSVGDFIMNEAGLTFDAGKGRVRVSGPIEILGRARDIAGRGWGLLLHWRDGDGRRHEWVMPQALAHTDGNRIVQHLADGGLEIGSGPRVRAMLVAYLAAANPERRITIVGRTGWHELPHGRVFVLPDRTIPADGLDVVLQAGEAGHAAFSRSGTLEGWQSGVARPAQDHARLAFVVSASLAGPLLTLADVEGGGFNLFGASSRGKSTALQVAASAWGRGGTPGFVASWRSTANGLEGTAALHADTLLVLDELGQASSQAAGEAAYLLANGIGKARASRTGEVRTPAQWRVLFLSSGEDSLAAKLMEDDTGRRPKGGQAVRIVDLPADAGHGCGIFDVLPSTSAEGEDAGRTLADALKTAAVRDFGHAGPAFIAALIAAELDNVRGQIRDIGAAFVQRAVPAGADGQVARVAARFALVAAGGELATRLKIVPWSEGRAIAATHRLFEDWLRTRGGTGAAETGSGISQVRQFLEAHGESRFEPIDTDLVRPVHNRVGFVRGRGEDRHWLVLPETWRSEVARGYDPGALIRALAERGMALLGEPDGRGSTKLQRKERSPLGNRRFYVVKSSIFDDERD